MSCHDIALTLVQRLHAAREQLAPTFDPLHSQESNEFDPSSLDNKRMIAAFEQLLKDGHVIVPRHPGVVRLTGADDGRRMRDRYPDTLEGWQFLGQVDDNGKPLGAPLWAAEQMRHYPGHGTAFGSPGGLLAQSVVAGDWIVRGSRYPHQAANVFLLPASAIERWYTIQP